jgi:Flp pilus assembly protein TadG
MKTTKTADTKHTQQRRGTSAVEVALTLPIFIMFLAALMEFGHVFMVSHMLKAAAKSGARYGSTPGVTTADVEARVQQIVASAINVNKATVLVKDAAVFDTSGVSPTTINYNTLPAIELSSTDQGHIYVVQVSVPYNQVALLPPFWVKNRTVKGQSAMRHE